MTEQSVIKNSVVPLDSEAVHVSAFACQPDGGAFLLRLYDRREAPERRQAEECQNFQDVEVAAFALSPLALVRLVNAISVAVATHRAVIGQELPVEADILRGYRKLSLGGVLNQEFLDSFTAGLLNASFGARGT
jgi:hypothetical protein